MSKIQGLVNQLNRIVRLVDGLLELVYPRLCCACLDDLAAGERVVCSRCRWELPLTYYWRMHDNYSVDILSGRFNMVHASSLLFYEHSHLSRNLIHKIKYSGRSDIAKELGVMYGRILRESEIYDDIDIIIPVPLHWSKRIKRGYNQSEVVAQSMAEVMNVNYKKAILKRRRRTQTQAHKKNRLDRWNNVSGAFRVTDCPKECRLDGLHVLLVDDVLTTGATIEACACELQRAYPSVRISVATLAVARRSARIKSIE